MSKMLTALEIPTAAAWGAATRFSGMPIFTHSYHYHRACVEALGETGDHASLEYPSKSFGADSFVTAPLERVGKRHGLVSIDALRSPEGIYVPYWDIVASSSDGRASPDVCEFLASDALGRWDVIQLADVLQGSAILTALEGSAGIAWRRSARPRCDFVECQSCESFLAGVSKNFRASLRKARNKLHKLADVRFVSHVEPAAVRHALARFFALESKGWKGAASGAIAQSPAKKRFYELLFESYANDPIGWVEINELHAAGDLLASQLCLGRRDTLFVWKIAYDEGYQKVSPGNMLLEWLVTRDGGDGRVRYLNLISDSSWHADWGASHIENWYVEIYNDTLAGRLVRAGRAAKELTGKRPQRGVVPEAGK